MKHQHNADVNVNVDIPADDIVRVVDKVTESAVIIIAATTVAHILKKVVQ